MQRNFQGYSTHAGSELYGFGVSAISQLDGAYAQNELGLNGYYAAIDEERPATARGYLLSADDRLRRHVIMQIMCDRTLDVRAVERRYGIDFPAYFADALADLQPLEADGLVTVTPERITVTDLGRFFIRNVAMPFDAHLRQQRTGQRRYSKTV